MIDFSLTELLVVGIVALIALKPEDIPSALRTMGQWMRKLKDVAEECREVVRDISKETGVDEVKDQVREIIDLDGNPQKAYDISDLYKLRKESGVKNPMK